MPETAAIVDARRPRSGLLMVVAGVLLVHGALLGGVPLVWPGSALQPPRALPVLARQLAADRPVAEPVAAAADVHTGPPSRTSPRPSSRPTSRASQRVAPALAPAPAPAPGEAPAVSTESAPAASDAPTEGDLPLYRTALPPPASLRYALTLGRLAGNAVLTWAPDGERYTASFEGRVAGLTMLSQTSRGTIVPHGLEPERFTDRRPRRGELAVNFDAAAGKVSFSGPSSVLAHHAGLQDRLSWLLQLAAIVAAEPERLRDGATVSLHLIGLRGDAGVWVLRSTGAQTVETPAGPLDSVRFVREPRGPYDGTVQLWLAAAPPHWPVRAVLGNGSEAGSFEWALLERP